MLGHLGTVSLDNSFLCKANRQAKFFFGYLSGMPRRISGPPFGAVSVTQSTHGRESEGLTRALLSVIPTSWSAREWGCEVPRPFDSTAPSEREITAPQSRAIRRVRLEKALHMTGQRPP